MRHLAALALGLSLAISAAAGEEERLLYSWTSGDGSVHYTDDSSRVPEEFRSSTKTFLARERREAQPVPSAAPAKPKEAASEPAAIYDGWSEVDWRAAAQRLDDAIAALAPVATACEKDHVNLSPGDGSRKRREEAEEARKCAEARSALANAQAEREALSERAHRAGAPPGWVRGE
jgi:hypothetical protein